MSNIVWPEELAPFAYSSGTVYLTDDPDLINADGDLAVEVTGGANSNGAIYGVGSPDFAGNVFIFLNGLTNYGSYMTDFYAGGDGANLLSVNVKMTDFSFRGNWYGGNSSGGMIGEINFSIYGTNHFNSSSNVYFAGNLSETGDVNITMSGSWTSGGHLKFFGGGSTCVVDGNVTMRVDMHLSTTGSAQMSVYAAGAAGTITGDVDLYIGKNAGLTNPSDAYHSARTIGISVSTTGASLIGGSVTVHVAPIANGDIAAQYDNRFGIIGEYLDLDGVLQYATLVVDSYTADKCYFSLGVSSRYGFGNAFFNGCTTAMTVKMWVSNMVTFTDSVMTLSNKPGRSTSDASAVTLNNSSLVISNNCGTTTAYMTTAIYTIVGENFLFYDSNGEFAAYNIIGGLAGSGTLTFNSAGESTTIKAWSGFTGNLITSSVVNLANLSGFTEAHFTLLDRGTLISQRNESVTMGAGGFSGNGIFKWNAATAGDVFTISASSQIAEFTGTFICDAQVADDTLGIAFTNNALASFEGGFNWGDDIAKSRFILTESGLSSFLIGGGTRTYDETKAFFSGRVTKAEGVEYAFGASKTGVLLFNAETSDAFQLAGKGIILYDGGVSVNAGISNFAGRIVFAVAAEAFAPMLYFANSGGTATGYSTYLRIGGTDYEARANLRIMVGGFVYTLAKETGLTLGSVAYTGQETDFYYGAGGTVTLSGNTVNNNVYAGGADLLSATELVVVDGLYNQLFAGGKFDGKSGTIEGGLGITISAGTATRIFGGAAAINGSDITVDTSTIGIDGQLKKASENSIWTYGGGIAASGSRLLIGQSAINVAGGGEIGNFIGGGRVEHAGIITTETVTIDITGGSAVSVAGGGYIYSGGTAKVISGTISIGAGAGAINVFSGGFISGTPGGLSEMGLATVSINGQLKSAVFGGSYLNSGTATVAGSTITVNGNIDRGVYGGGYVEGGTETVEDVSIMLAGGDILGPVFAGAYTTGGGSTVKNVSITLDGANLTGNLYAGGYARGGYTAVERVSITLSSNYLGTVFAGGFISSGTATTGSVTVRFAGYEGDTAEFSGDFDKFNFDAACMDVQFGDDFTFGNSLVNVDGGIYDAALDSRLFDISYAMNTGNLTLDGNALADGAADTGAYTLVWDSFYNSLLLVGEDSIGNYDGPDFKLFHVA